MRRSLLSVLSFLAIAATSPAAAQSPDSRRVEIPRVEGRPVLDGRLDEPMWSRAVRLTDFVQVEPGELRPPSRRTVAYLAYDDHYIYFAVEAFEERSADVRATLFQRERGGETDDRVTLILDTFNDRRRAYEFSLTPFGIQRDGVKVEGQDADESVDLVWHSTGRTTDAGWVVEAQIPFASLRFPRGDGLTFGVNVLRDYGRTGERDSWYPRRRGWPCDICQQGELAGISGVARRRTIDVLPYLNARSDGLRAFADTTVTEGGAAYPTSRPLGFRMGSPEQRVGGDVRLAVTPAMVVHGTINPDFSQIEADEDQIRVGQRFALSFDERRPFFLEGRDVLNAGIGGLGDLFYSRAIVNPDAGVRVTAREQGFTIGALYARDASPAYWWNDGYQRSGYVADGLSSADVVIVRARRDVLEDSYLGVVTLGRSGSGSRNGMIGADFSLRSGAFTLTGEGGLSDDRAPLLVTEEMSEDTEDAIIRYDTSAVLDGRGRRGHYYQLELTRSGRHFSAEAGIAAVSDDFRHQLGRFSRVGIRRYDAELEFTQYPNNRLLRRIEQSLEGRAVHRYGFGGGLLDYAIEPEISFEFQRQTSLDLGLLIERVTLPNEVLGIDVPVYVTAATMSASTAATRTLSASAFLLVGQRELYDFTNPREGAGYIANVSATVRPTIGSAVQLRWQRSVRQEEWGGETVDRATILRVRGTHQFSRTIGIRLIGEHSDQYDALDSNPLERRGVRMGWSALFHWEIAPASQLYAGFADELREFDSRVSRDRVVRTGASAFVKVSYLLRL